VAALYVALQVGLHLRGVRAGCTEGTFRPHLIIVGTSNGCLGGNCAALKDEGDRYAILWRNLIKTGGLRCFYLELIYPECEYDSDL